SGDGRRGSGDGSRGKGGAGFLDDRACGLGHKFCSCLGAIPRRGGRIRRAVNRKTGLEWAKPKKVAQETEAQRKSPWRTVDEPRGPGHVAPARTHRPARAPHARAGKRRFAMGTNLPPDRGAAVNWILARMSMWSTSAAQIGLDEAEVSSLQTLAGTAQ